MEPLAGGGWCGALTVPIELALIAGCEPCSYSTSGFYQLDEVQHGAPNRPQGEKGSEGLYSAVRWCCWMFGCVIENGRFVSLPSFSLWLVR